MVRIHGGEPIDQGDVMHDLYTVGGILVWGATVFLAAYWYLNRKM